MGMRIKQRRTRPRLLVPSLMLGSAILLLLFVSAFWTNQDNMQQTANANVEAHLARIDASKAKPANPNPASCGDLGPMVGGTYQFHSTTNQHVIVYGLVCGENACSRRDDKDLGTTFTITPSEVNYLYYRVSFIERGVTYSFGMGDASCK